MTFRVGVVGARGHVGSELLPMLARHPKAYVAWVTSSSAVGEPVQGAPELRYRAPSPSQLLHGSDAVDVVVLALPNGQSEPWVAEAFDTRLVDLSTDHRSDAEWVYAQPERFRERIRGARRVSSPGCYATAAQLALAPVADLVDGAAHVFGVSGYSGAGTTRGPRNDPAVLHDNLMPYSLVGHAHERELRHHLPCAVHFMPHVASFFRGLSVTVSFETQHPTTRERLHKRYVKAYAGEHFVQLMQDAPMPKDSVGTHGVRIGGLSLSADGKHAVVVAALDNLLGGAASQALRAMNLALGVDEAAGL